MPHQPLINLQLLSLFSRSAVSIHIQREKINGVCFTFLFFPFIMKRNSSSSPHKSMAAVDHNARKSLFMAALYCEEEDETPNFDSKITLNKDKFIKHSLLLEYDFCCCELDDEQLQSLFSKERETSLRSTRFSPSPASVLAARKQGVEIILRSSSHHGFSASAAIFAVNFLDRFLFDYLHLSFEKDGKPWLMQLVAVACLSLAAKVEETHVPLLVDLQVEDAKYLFEAKTIQRMELLILSALKWRMNPVTPLSFIHHIVTRLGLKSYVIQLEFLKSCQDIILSLISDSRFASFYPSVMASATVLHIVNQVDNCGNAVECEKIMFDVLKIRKEEVEDCYGFILDVVSNSDKKKGLKRQKWELSWSDHIIIDNVAVMNSESASSSSSSSSSLSSHSPPLKKHKT